MTCRTQPEQTTAAILRIPEMTAAAVHLVMVAREDPETMEAVRRAVAVPDGMPLVWALRALGHRATLRWRQQRLRPRVVILAHDLVRPLDGFIQQAGQPDR